MSTTTTTKKQTKKQKKSAKKGSVLPIETAEEEQVEPTKTTSTKPEKKKLKIHTMPGFEDNKKECDTELVENTVKSFRETDLPSLKATHLTSLCWLAKQIGEKEISINGMFSIIKSKLDIGIGSKAGDKFRTILYNDYYPQTRKGKDKQVKGVDTIKYAYDNSVYCTVPLVSDIDRNPRKLWGIKFKPEFVKMAQLVEIDTEKLSDNLKS